MKIAQTRPRDLFMNEVHYTFIIQTVTNCTYIKCDKETTINTSIENDRKYDNQTEFWYETQE